MQGRYFDNKASYVDVNAFVDTMNSNSIGQSFTPKTNPYSWYMSTIDSLNSTLASHANVNTALKNTIDDMQNKNEQKNNEMNEMRDALFRLKAKNLEYKERIKAIEKDNDLKNEIIMNIPDLMTAHKISAAVIEPRVVFGHCKYCKNYFSNSKILNEKLSKYGYIIHDTGNCRVRWSYKRYYDYDRPEEERSKRSRSPSVYDSEDKKTKREKISEKE